MTSRTQSRRGLISSLLNCNCCLFCLPTVLLCFYNVGAMESQGRFSGPSEEGWGGGNKTLALALGGEGSRGKVTPSGPSLPPAAPRPWGLLLCLILEVLQGIVQQGKSRFTRLPCCRGTESREVCAFALQRDPRPQPQKHFSGSLCQPG